MGIEADKESIGSIVWVDRCKFAQDRANEGDHNTSDIGVLWAEDKIATLTADHTALVEKEREIFNSEVEAKKRHDILAGQGRRLYELNKKNMELEEHNQNAQSLNGLLELRVEELEAENVQWEKIDAKRLQKLATLQAKYEHAYNALLAEQKENTALVEAARAVLNREERIDSLAALLDTSKGASDEVPSM